jgi:hypothetical protein
MAGAAPIQTTNLSKPGTNARSQKLTECDRHVVEGDHAAAVPELFSESLGSLTLRYSLSRRKFRDVQRDHHGCAANTETDNEAANRELRKVKRRGLQDSANDEDNASKEDRHLATMLIRDHASDDSANKRTARCERSHELLLRGGEFVTERRANSDKNRGDVARVIALMLSVYPSRVVMTGPSYQIVTLPARR